MAKTHKVTPMARLVNSFMRGLIRLGLGPREMRLLSVPGRKSGKIYSTPVMLIEKGQERWLVAPYGEVGWVRNARAAGQVTLSRGGHSETKVLTELGPEESAPILKEYITRVSITRPYFDVTPDSSLQAFSAEAPRHPVFCLQNQ